MEDPSYLIFQLGRDRFAIDVKSVGKAAPGYAHPELQDGCQVIDARALFGVENAPEAESLIRVTGKDQNFWMKVDHIEAVQTIPDQQIVPPQSLFAGPIDSSVKGIVAENEEYIVLLQPDRLEAELKAA